MRLDDNTRTRHIEAKAKIKMKKNTRVNVAVVYLGCIVGAIRIYSRRRFYMCIFERHVVQSVSRLLSHSAQCSYRKR